MKQNYKNFLVFLFAIVIQIGSYAQRTNSNHVHVDGYTRSNGTYVEPHYRTAPNSTNRDNFSTSGNTNPYTGQAGWVAPDNKPLVLPETNYPSSSISTYNYPTSTSSESDFDYKKYIDLEISRKNSIKSDYHFFSLDASSSDNNSFNSNFTSPPSDFNLYSTNETLTTISKSVRNSINYHDRYSFDDKIILEKALNKLGYYVGDIDGWIDNNTIDAIKGFQRDNGLIADGKAGDATVKKMAVKLRE